MGDKFITRWFWASLDTYTYNEKHLLSTEKKKAYLRSRVNYQEFADKIRDIYEEMDNLGYDVINVIPINNGQSEDVLSMNKTFLGSYNYSITQGTVVVGKKRS